MKTQKHAGDIGILNSKGGLWDNSATEKCAYRTCFKSSKCLSAGMINLKRIVVSVSSDLRNWRGVADIRGKPCNEQPLKTTKFDLPVMYARFEVATFYGEGGGLQSFEAAGPCWEPELCLNG